MNEGEPVTVIVEREVTRVIEVTRLVPVPVVPGTAYAPIADGETGPGVNEPPSDHFGDIIEEIDWETEAVWFYYWLECFRLNPSWASRYDNALQQIDTNQDFAEQVAADWAIGVIRSDYEGICAHLKEAFETPPRP